MCQFSNLPELKVCGKRIGRGVATDKGSFIKANMEKHKISFEEALFVDDSTENIASAKGRADLMQTLSVHAIDLDLQTPYCHSDDVCCVFKISLRLATFTIIVLFTHPHSHRDTNPVKNSFKIAI